MAKRTPSEINSWFNRFVRWLRSLLGIRRKITATSKTSQYSKDRGTALFTIERDVPGAVETWRLVNSQTSRQLLITLDNLEECREYYKAERRKASEFGRKYSATAEERGLYLANSKAHTHRFSISWIEQTTQGRHVVLLGVWDGDFAGTTLKEESSASRKLRSISTKDKALIQRLGNSKAIDLGKAIALELLELKPLPRFSWEERINGYDWKDVLLSYTQHVHKKYDFDPKIICRS